jgi:DNA-directed RNA polymerase specialized sigma24 family protein
VRPRLLLSAAAAAELSRFVARRVDNVDDAADITQQTVLLACAELRSSRVENLTRWLHTIAHNLIVDHYRAQSRFRFTGLRSELAEVEPALQTRPDLPLAIVESRERLNVLLNCVTRLVWLEHQVAVLLSDIYGYADKHSAAQMQMTVSCFKLMLHGARGQLHDLEERALSGMGELPPVRLRPRLGVSCGVGAPELFAIRGKLLEGLK